MNNGPYVTILPVETVHEAWVCMAGNVFDKDAVDGCHLRYNFYVNIMNPNTY